MSISRTAALLLLFIILPTAVWPQSAPRKPIVTARVLLSQDALRIGKDFRVAVKVKVADGYHIGSAEAKEPSIPSKLVLKAVPGVTFDAPKYPKAKTIAFEFAGDEKLSVYDGQFTVFVTGHVARDAKLGKRVISAEFRYQACSETTCAMPSKATASVNTRVVGARDKVAPANSDVFGSTKASAPVPDKVSAVFGRGAIFGFAAMFLLGLGLCFTPCVYPMVPVTVGYFGMQSEKRTSRVALLAACYVIGIATTYSAIGVAAAQTGVAFGAALQNPFVPIGIAAILVLLALSMFGLYELRPPQWIASRAQGRSGPVGALLMGLIFGVVAAPCVGPVTVSLLLYVAKVGKPLFGFFTFFTLSLGMGTPLFFLAMFSGAINKLPQAGVWMVSIRKVFGLLLIGAAAYFVTPIVRTSVSAKAGDMLLPMVIMISGFYIGWLEPSLRKAPKLKAARKFVGVSLLLIGILQIPTAGLPKGEPIHFAPYSKAALAQAIESGKPVLIDFTADWCTYCHELEKKTFPDPRFKEEAARFVLLKADVTGRGSAEVQELIKKYRVPGPPVILFINSDGTEAPEARSSGFIKAEDLVDLMRLVK